MAKRDKYFWCKLLGGIAMGMLLIDVLALTVLVAPLAAVESERGATPELSARLTQTALELALIIPTRDRSKPWPTLTPVPTATPWFVPSVTPTPRRTATLGPSQQVAQIPTGEVGTSTASPVGVAKPASRAPTSSPDSHTGASNPIAEAPTATPTEQATSLPPSPTTASAAEATDIPPTVTPQPEALVERTATPSPTSAPATAQPPPPIAAGNQAQFKGYLQDHYNTIGGQALEVVGVSFITAGAGIPGVRIEVKGEGANNVFAGQPAAAVLDYGRRLLNDAKFYFSGQPCAVTVISKYDTPNLDTCKRDSNWCYVRGLNQASKTWSIQWTYLQGTSVGGTESVQAWSQGS